MDFTRLFVDIDDYWKASEKIYAKHLIEDGTRKRNRKSNLSTSEIMTILIAITFTNIAHFKYKLWRHIQLFLFFRVTHQKQHKDQQSESISFLFISRHLDS
jgi:hypothetical protein